jgi:NifU-like protein involved in Fe-S cluster formation
MSDLLYAKDVLRLAADATGAGRLPHPDGSYLEHNPTCGDRTIVDLQIANGRITAMAHDTKACVLAQASASILGSHLHGSTLADLLGLRAQIVDMLKGGASPNEPFDGYGALTEVAGFPSRHRCVLLPLDAAIKAFEASQASEPR